ncbi:MAG TPA: glycosyltransferase family 4 protein [Steroidobacteraceae bacterium]|nr:glycosyltransferase family 4 protein [Steroidobacteraceae bacterium]
MSAPQLQFVLPGSLTEVTGGYQYDRRLIEGLRSLGWEITVHLLDGSFPFPTSAALAGSKAVLASLPDEVLVLIDGLALGAMPDVVAAHADRLRLVGLIHHPLALENGLTHAIAQRLRGSEEAALRYVRHVIATSAFTRDGLASYGVASARISIVEPGTDEAPLAQGSEDDSCEILCVANLIPRKGHDLLIEALRDLQHLKWRLTCVGSTTRSPQTAAELRCQIDAAGLGARIRMPGELDGAALEQCFGAADLFVLPTRHEGYGMVVAEAVAHGLPVLGTRTGAIPELVLPEAGRVVPPNDAGALRDALSELLTEPHVLARFAKGARAARVRLPRWPQACAAAASVLIEAARR